MKIAVCDDEEVICEQIRSMIQEQLPECQVDTYQSGQLLLEREQNYDILFLDIQMEGINGMEIARALRKKGEAMVLIFITGRKEYVFEAFDVSAFHYLLKPVEKEKLVPVLGRAVKEVKKNKQQSSKQLFVKTKQRNITINVADILYIESRRRKVEIHTIKGNVELYASMKDLENDLDKRFYRCHRGYLVNMAYILEYRKDSIDLYNGETIYLAKEKYGDFVKAYMHYLQKGGVTFV